jgi:aryl-alcohol dehydrogenase-like predicted oxidoreductase
MRMRYRTWGRAGLEVSEIGSGGAKVGIPNSIKRRELAGAAE